MKKLFIFCLVIISSIVFGQTKKVPYLDDNNFNGKNAWLFDSVLCTKEFAGRKSGLIGAVKANHYIASEFEKWGVKPKGDDNSYIQKFDMLVTEDITIPKMVIKNARRGELKLSEGEDFALFTNSGSGDIESEVVFVGYGLSEDCWDDYKNVDVKGKIVLMLSEMPNVKDCNLQERGGRGSKFKTAYEKGATAVLISSSGNRLVKGAAINKEHYNKNVIGAYLLDWVVRELFKGTGKTFEEIQQQLSSKPQSFNLNKKMLFSSKTKQVENGFGQNVIGMIEGNEKKNEYIIFGAHTDHLGISPNGLFYQGADDNASGTAFVMELARVLSKKKDIKRNILFIGFGAEEQGLLGSNFFVEHPTIPKSNMALMFNFDMVGVGDGGLRISGVETISTYWNEFYSSLTSEEKNKIRTGRLGLGGSDHTGFKLEGIPALFIASSGSHKFYHNPEDTYETIDSKVFQNVGDIIEKFALFMANYDRDIIHRYRNEKNFFNGCNITDLSNDADFIFLKNEALQKEKIIDGMQIKLFPIDAGNALEDMGKYITFSEGKNDYVNLLFSPTELRSNANSLKILTVPIVKNFNGNKELFNIFTKMKINFYDFTNKKDEKVLGEIKNSYILCRPTEIDFYQKVSPSNKFFVKGEIAELKGLEKKENTLYIVTITNETNLWELNSIVKNLGYKNIHLDVSELLMKDENQVYQILRQSKQLDYNDNMLKSLLGRNFIDMF
jgi:hypothetical protein